MSRRWSTRREEQYLCAILHAASPLGLFAIVSSIVVFAGKRDKSAFVAIQSLQAALFQGLSLLLFGGTFLIVMGGFQYAAVSGLIAQTGVTNPELTNQLIIVGGVAFGFIYFFQFVFPLIGIYGAIRTLSGVNFRYPILGRLATRWSKPDRNSDNNHSAMVEDDSGGDEKSKSIVSGVANLLVVFGLAAVVNPMIWALSKGATKRDRFALLQAALYDLLLKAAVAFLFFGFFILFIAMALLGPSTEPFIASIFSGPMSGDLPGLLFFGLIALVYVVGRGIAFIGAIAEFSGRQFSYPFIGRRLENYLTRL